MKEETNMNIIKQMNFNKWDLITVAIILMILPYLMPFQNSFFYELNKDRVENISKDKVVVFYDHFDEEHGENVVESFMSRMSEEQDDYEIVKINSSGVIKVQVIKMMIDKLLLDGKEVYLNSSICPGDPIHSYQWLNVYTELGINENITITQAAGNQQATFLDTGNEFDNRVYEELNKRKEELKKIILNEEDNNIISYGIYGEMYISLKNFIGYGRNGKIERLVDDVVKYVMRETELPKGLQREDVVDIYKEQIIDFSFAVLLSENPTGVILVGSDTNMEKENGDIIENFLDFKIKGLIKVDERERAWIGDGENQKIGTSISSPFVLASYVQN